MPVSIALLLVAGIVAGLGVRTLATRTYWVNHTVEVLGKIELVTRLAIDAQSEERGYLLVGDPAYLPRFARAIAMFDTEVAALTELTADNPVQRTRVAQLVALAHDRFDAMKRVIAAKSAGDDATWRAVIERGRTPMEELRHMASTLSTTERDLLAQRSRDADHAALFVAMTVAMLIALAIALLIANESTWRRAAQTMRQQDARLGVILRSVGDGLIATDAEGRIEFMNETASLLTGWREDDARGRLLPHVYRTLREADRGSVETLAERALREGRIVGRSDHTLLVDRHGRERPVDETAAPIRDDGQFIGVVLAFRDATEARLAAQEIRQLNASLEARVHARTAQLAEANSQMEVFTYTVSHDLRAPLRAVRGFSQFLKQDYRAALDAQAMDYLDRIGAAASRMDALIEDLLAYSRVTRRELDLERVALETALDEALESLASDIARRSARIEVARPLGDVQAHRGTLVQVLQNVCSNAVKFVPPERTPHVRIASVESGELRCLQIDDNGIGIPAEHRERVFAVFERLHTPRDYEGTGIGLAIVRKGVERMGGSVDIETPDDGIGTRVWVRLLKARD